MGEGKNEGEDVVWERRGEGEEKKKGLGLEREQCVCMCWRRRRRRRRGCNISGVLGESKHQRGEM